MSDSIDTLSGSWLTGETPLPSIVRTTLDPAPVVDPVVHDPCPHEPVISDFVLPAFDHTSPDHCDTPDDQADAQTDAQTDRPPSQTIAWRLGHRDGVAAGMSEGGQAGFAQGFERGRAEAHDACRAASADVIRSLRRQIDTSVAHLAAVADEVTTASTELAFQIAVAVLEREVCSSDDPAAEAMARALAALPDDLLGGPVTVHLHPGDLSLLAVDTSPATSSSTLDLVGDPTVSPGGCRLDAGPTHVDACIDSALGRVRLALGLGAPAATVPATADEATGQRGRR